MRKNSVRKFIHAILDLLPLLIIPIFAININQKSVEPIQVEVQEKISVDFNQLRKNDFTYTNVGVNVVGNQSAITITGTATQTTIFSLRLSDTYTIQNHWYLIRFNNYIDLPRLSIYSFSNRGTGSAIYVYNFSNYDDMVYRKFQSTQDNADIELGVYTVNGTIYNSTTFINVFDLTEMGLEDITIEEFNSMFTNENYAYTESQKMLVNKPSYTTYDETDVGSQFLYSLYIPVHDYFNFNNLFNMGAIYDWIQLNLFSGTAPLPVFIIWNIIVYEFFVDLIFLLYSVFMFVIDFTTNTIDSFVNKSRRL